MTHLNPTPRTVLPPAADAAVRRMTDDLVIDVVDPDTGETTELGIVDSHPGDALATVESLITALEHMAALYRSREQLMEYGAVA